MPMSEQERVEVIARRQRFLSPAVNSLSIFHGDPFVVERGEGCALFDAAGRRYVDCTAQNVCISLGFGHPLTVAAVREQVARMAHCTTLFHHELPGRYAEELVAKMPAGDWVVHLVNSGSEAIDLAYAMARAHTGRFELLTLRNAYHGAHFGAVASTAFSVMKPATPQAPGFVQVIHPDAYKGVFGPDVEPYLAELERTIYSATTGRVAGMIIEPIQGFGGVVPMPEGYMRRAFEIVRAAGGLAIVDEVQTGWGRLGSHYWGFEAHGVSPDLVVLGKGMGNGLPIAGVVARREVAESFARHYFFNTYGSNPVAVAAARSVIAGLDAEQRQAHALAMGERALAGFRRLQRKHDLIGDVRGAGLFLGVELVKDRGSKAPAGEEARRVNLLLRDQGVVMVAGSGGRNVLRFNPSLCIGAADVDLVLEGLDRALAAV